MMGWMMDDAFPRASLRTGAAPISRISLPRLVPCPKVYLQNVSFFSLMRTHIHMTCPKILTSPPRLFFSAPSSLPLGDAGSRTTTSARGHCPEVEWAGCYYKLSFLPRHVCSQQPASQAASWRATMRCGSQWDLAQSESMQLAFYCFRASFALEHLYFFLILRALHTFLFLSLRFLQLEKCKRCVSLSCLLSGLLRIRFSTNC